MKSRDERAREVIADVQRTLARIEIEDQQFAKYREHKERVIQQLRKRARS
jgi:hypothetical protein